MEVTRPRTSKNGKTKIPAETQACIHVDRELWNLFAEYANRNGLSRSKIIDRMIRGFIQQTLDERTEQLRRDNKIVIEQLTTRHFQLRQLRRQFNHLQSMAEGFSYNLQQDTEADTP